jgi:hypothetical protein
MSALIPFLILNQTCEQVQVWINEKLTHIGFRVVRTFDLHVARLAHSNCACPRHGTDDCNCQLIIVLVYGKQGDPATLVIYGQDGRAWLSLAVPASGHGNQHLESVIRHTLIPRHTNMITPIEVIHEA